MCLSSCSWQISSRRSRLERNMDFISPNSLLLIHHEFEGEGGVLELYYVSMYTCIVFPLYEGFSVYLSPVHVLYIVAFGPWEYKLHISLTWYHELGFFFLHLVLGRAPRPSSPCSVRRVLSLLLLSSPAAAACRTSSRCRPVVPWPSPSSRPPSFPRPCSSAHRVLVVSI